MMFGIMFALHNVDQYRAERRTDKIQTELQNRMPATVALFSPITKQSLSSEPSPNTDEETARLLRAIEVSTPHDPQVSVIVTAESPYTHCIITALPKRESLTPEDDWEYLRRQYLTGFPSNWEKDAVQAGFEGKEISVPDEKAGVFFNSRVPSSWGIIKKDDRVLGIIMFKGSI
ncbi:hypothetical protein H1P_6500009 [Hyella patelloides LEGE 07179]|uniref:Uncharacterized protein n=1 Tax=Hyella patelloides LEGE 07179 TaxID=945734 RepID=A0A563W2E2_9CYAN